MRHINGSRWCSLAGLLVCLFLGASSACAHTNLANAYAEIGFDPRFPGNVPVVLFSDAHMNLNLSVGWSPVPTTNLDVRLLSAVNAMDPPPAKIIVAGDACTTLSEIPGENGVTNPVAVCWATNEMAYFLAAIKNFTNVAFTNIVWVPGNHDQGPFEVPEASLWRQMFPMMPPYQAFDLAGVRFFLLNSGNYAEPSDAMRAWLTQQLAATSPTQTVAVVEHFPPFFDPACARGMGAMLKQFFATWPSRWWVFSGHTHGEWEEVYDVGLSNVASFTIASANTNMTGPLAHGPGFQILCLSNGIVGAVYYHFDTASFEVIYSHASFPTAHSSWQHPVHYTPAFTDVSGLIWRRLKMLGQPPEVLLATNSVNPNPPDSMDWYCYPTELRLQLPLGRHANQATHFLLLVSGYDPPYQRVQFSTNNTDWTDAEVPPPPYTSSTVAFAIPPEIARCDTAYARFLAPADHANVFIGGWGLSTTNGPPFVTFPQLAPVPLDRVIVGHLVTVTNHATDPYAPPDRFQFSLLSGPAGATLNATNGMFTWRPGIADAVLPQPVSFAVKVADNGTPEMSATQQLRFNVTVSTAPLLDLPVYKNGQAQVTVWAVPGTNYTVSTSTNLRDWTVLFVTNPPAMPFLINDSPADRLRRRFYRVAFDPQHQ